jgi:hypothetical protein
VWNVHGDKQNHMTMHKDRRGVGGSRGNTNGISWGCPGTHTVFALVLAACILSVPVAHAEYCSSGCDYGTCQCISGLAECQHNDCVVKTGPVIGIVVAIVVVIVVLICWCCWCCRNGLVAIRLCLPVQSKSYPHRSLSLSLVQGLCPEPTAAAADDGHDVRQWWWQHALSCCLSVGSICSRSWYTLRNRCVVVCNNQ